jgi:hypothetical protein
MQDSRFSRQRAEGKELLDFGLRDTGYKKQVIGER